jgi:serine/threonine protein phosphatase PrpC
MFDNFSTIGKTHRTCEDYSISDKNFLIICDGCSSSKDTDLGSRLLAYSAKETIKKYSPSILNLEDNIFNRLVLSNVKYCLSVLNLPITVADSTLLIVTEHDEKYFTHFFGDGISFMKLKNGDVIIKEISYKENAPFYLTVYDDHTRTKQWLEFFPENIQEVKTATIKNGGGEGSLEQIPQYEYCAFEIDKNKVELIGIASDGLSSFINELGERINLIDVVKEVLSIKNYNGEFLKRRMIRMLKDYQAKGFTNYDDVSVAILVNREEEDEKQMP